MPGNMSVSALEVRQEDDHMIKVALEDGRETEAAGKTATEGRTAGGQRHGGWNVGPDTSSCDRAARQEASGR